MLASDRLMQGRKQGENKGSKYAVILRKSVEGLDFIQKTAKMARGWGSLFRQGGNILPSFPGLVLARRKIESATFPVLHIKKTAVK
jgi:hypothetical protein